MKDRDLEPEFSWPLALLITGVCFLGFHYILQKLNGNNPPIFLWIGITSLIMCFAIGAVSVSVKSKITSKHEETDPSNSPQAD